MLKERPKAKGQKIGKRLTDSQKHELKFAGLVRVIRGHSGKSSKFKNMLITQERQRTFILDTAQNHGNNLFLG